jgi:hypothetical protein
MKEMKITEFFSIKDIFNSGDKYVIPIYQRDYAWGETEITQLIQDIADYVKKENKPNYYIGTLIVWERRSSNEKKFETIDGQQRLTTLSILLSLIKKEYPKNEYPNVDLSWYEKLNLEFDSRRNSTKTLKDLLEGRKTEDNDCNAAVIQGYEIIKNALPRIINEKGLFIEDFCSCLLENVMILRVLVPEDTDLNHYFEIMNSRGEQLEKHEIIKERMLKLLDEHDRPVFNLIWEACSNMEKYMQYGFNKKQRDIIFGNNWNDLSNNLTAVYGICESLNTQADNEQSKNLSIADLLKPGAEQDFEKIQNDNDYDEEKTDRFNTIIDFSNFLLHILRIQIKKDVPLDDKRLIELFNPYLDDSENKIAENKIFVKEFGYNLLKGKFLLDKYVIKKDYSEGKDRWSLKQLKNNNNYINTFGAEDGKNDINGEILMLLLMFHVTTPAFTYKNWLYAVLKFVFENTEEKELSPQEYKEYLEGLAKAFLYDRFLAKEPKEYHEIIYTNNGASINKDINIEKLDQGTGVENFIFNYLDYLLWQNYRTAEKAYFTGKFKNNNETRIHDERIENFEYTSGNSVEHYYPQQPFGGNISIALTDDEKKQNKPDWLNNFGNLCLISREKNSRLSNFMPDEKKGFYNKSQTIDSIKQRIMMEHDKWDIKEIEEHGIKMKELLLSAFL